MCVHKKCLLYGFVSTPAVCQLLMSTCFGCLFRYTAVVEPYQGTAACEGTGPTPGGVESQTRDGRQPCVAGRESMDDVCLCGWHGGSARRRTERSKWSTEQAVCSAAGLNADSLCVCAVASASGTTIEMLSPTLGNKGEPHSPIQTTKTDCVKP